MVPWSRTAAVLLVMATLVVPACTRYVDDARAVAGADLSTAPTSDVADASQCEEVDVPLTAIPAKNDDEPVMKIPQPRGWVRSTMMDSELIRFAMANESLTAEGFRSNVVVTFESAPGIEDPDVVFANMRDALEQDVGVTDLRTTEHTLCGLPAETIEYQMPVMGNVAPHPAIAIAAVLQTEDTTFAASVTAQTTDASNATYQRDVETILKGFQLLPPSPN